MVNSGGASGENDLAQAACRGDQHAAGGTGLICWCKALQKPIQEGMEALLAAQDVYSSGAVNAAGVGLVAGW